MKLDKALMEKAAAIAQPLDSAIVRSCEAISHNLNGQRLGRKGRYTRERIIRAAIELLEGDCEEPFTLSAVARLAGLRMSSLYTYFNDLSELMIAVLEPVMASAEATYMERIRDYWPDEDLQARCLDFLLAYRQFWLQHSALLHQRNRMSDAGDERMLQHRFEAVQPLLDRIEFQLGLGDEGKAGKEVQALAAVLMTGIERTMTVQTHPNYLRVSEEADRQLQDFALPGARLLRLAIRDSREELRQSRS